MATARAKAFSSANIAHSPAVIVSTTPAHSRSRRIDFHHRDAPPGSLARSLSASLAAITKQLYATARATAAKCGMAAPGCAEAGESTQGEEQTDAEFLPRQFLAEHHRYNEQQEVCGHPVRSPPLAYSFRNLVKYNPARNGKVIRGPSLASHCLHHFFLRRSTEERRAIPLVRQTPFARLLALRRIRDRMVMVAASGLIRPLPARL